jgi:cysteinyl-tRNA synthetase
MSSRYLGPSFDIHGGGMDLIFPHHENELAQSRAATGPDSFARYWLHNGFINVRTAENAEEKMSKSLGNFFTIRQVCAQHEPEALRLFLLGTHYRSPISFEVSPQDDGRARFTSLEDAERRLSYTYTTISRLNQALSSGKSAGEGAVLPPVDTFMTRFREAMDDDFNAAAALGQVSELLPLANKLLDQPKSAPKDVRRRTLEAIQTALCHVHQILGIFGQDPDAFLLRRRTKLAAARGIEPTQVEARIQERFLARQAKDFAKADAIRQELVTSGVELMDGPTGTTWRICEDINYSGGH